LAQIHHEFSIHFGTEATTSGNAGEESPSVMESDAGRRRVRWTISCRSLARGAQTSWLFDRAS